MDDLNLSSNQSSVLFLFFPQNDTYHIVLENNTLNSVLSFFNKYINRPGFFSRTAKNRNFHDTRVSQSRADQSPQKVQVKTMTKVKCKMLGVVHKL